jgi:hypothetical protein
MNTIKNALLLDTSEKMKAIFESTEDKGLKLSKLNHYTSEIAAQDSLQGITTIKSSEFSELLRKPD